MITQSIALTITQRGHHEFNLYIVTNDTDLSMYDIFYSRFTLFKILVYLIKII